MVLELNIAQTKSNGDYYLIGASNATHFERGMVTIASNDLKVLGIENGTQKDNNN